MMIVGLCALAALLELDTAYVGQFMLSRPTMAGAILGYAAGDFMTGLQLGLFAELLFLDHVPVGGNVPPSGVFWTVSALVAASIFSVPLPLAFFLGMLAGLLYSKLEIWLRSLRYNWSERIESELDNGGCNLWKWVLKALAMQYFCGFALALAASFAAGYTGAFLWQYMPRALQSGMTVAYLSIPWIGLAMLMVNLYSRARAK